jgi:hypothetical protein
MLKKGLWVGGLLVGLLVVGLVSADAKPIDQLPVQSSVEVSRFFKDDEQVILELATPDYTLTPVDLSIGKFDRLTAPDRAYTDRAGYPQMPLQGFAVGVPPGARVELEILSDDVVQLPGSYRLSPAPEPAPLTGDLQPGQMRDVMNAAAYSANTLYPTRPALITQDAWLREQRIIRIELYPFQIRADDGALIWHRHLRVAVHFYRTTAPGLARSIAAGPSPFESVLRGALVNYEAAKQWRAQPADQPLSISDQPALNKAVGLSPTAASACPQITCTKITVDHDGLYRITYADLITAGVVMTGIDPGNFHLTSQQQDVAIYVSNQTPGVFAPGDFIEFYGQKFRGDVLAARYAGESSQWLTYSNGWHSQFSAAMLEKYTDDNVYWLNVNGPAGPRMAAIDGTPDGVSPVPTYYTTTVHAEQSKFWWTYSSNSGSLPGGEDTWWWESVQNSGATVTKTYTTTLSAIANVPQAAIVRGEVAARTENPAGSPDHRTQFWLNSEVAPLADSTWDGLTRHHFEAYVPQTDLISGTNRLSMTVIAQPALPNDNIYFDWFEIQYARLFQAADDQILFSDASIGSRQYVITNFVTSTLSVYNITNPLLPQRILSATLASSGGSVTTTIGVSSTTPITYYIVGADVLQKPKSIATYAPPDLLSASNGADYIIIAPTAFVTASQTLATYRAEQGLRVKVVDVADLYNQFNDGIYHPIAIKNFLAYAYSNWQKPEPAYAVLVGDGHWNFKNQGAYGAPTIYMPPFLAFVDPWQGEVDATNLLAAFVGNDILPDISIGRLPVNSVTELNTVISKTMSFEQAGPQAYQTGSLFLADNADAAGNFKQLSDELIASNYPSHFQAMRVYEDDLYAQGSCCRNGTNVITKTLNQPGTLFLTYSGHGGVNRWTDESLLIDTDIPQLTNLNRLPIILSLTCLDGYWYFPPASQRVGFMEQMMRAANGGAVATFSPSGLGISTGHNALMSGMLDAIFKDGVQRLGPATIAGKVNVYVGGDGLDLINTYTILGDPALRLPLYLINASPSTAAKSGNSGSVVTYTLQITNLAYLYDQITVTLSGNAWSAAVVAPIVAPQSTASAGVLVTIPALSLPGAVDVVSVTIASHGDSTPAYHAVLTTTTNAFYRFNLATATDAQSQVPGAIMTYTLQLTNSGNLTDTFALSNTGNVWPGSLSVYSLTLLPFASTNVVVSTTVPPAALMNVADVLTVNVRSSGSGLSQSEVFTTTAGARYQGSLAPSSGQQSIDPGATASYTLWLTNTGNVTDAFNLTLTNNVWVAAVNPASTVALAIGGNQLVVLTATAPITALAGTSNSIGVLATSQGDGTQAQAIFTTTVQPVYVFHLSPLTNMGLDEPGAVVTYTLQVTNDSNISDTFNVSLAGNHWPTVADPMSVGPLPARSVSSLAVYVHSDFFAPPNSTDSVSVTVTSAGNGAQLSAVLTTVVTNTLFGLDLTSAVNAQAAVPSGVAVYTLHLTNTGGTTDTFALSPIGNDWPVSIAPNSSGPLSATFGTVLLVSVTVPSNQVVGTSDVVTVTGVSQASGVSAGLQLTTTANASYGLTLAPNGVSQSGAPNAVAIYTLYLTNTGNTTDTFNLTPSGAVSVFSLSANTLTLAPFATGSINVTGTVPSAALFGGSSGLTLTATSMGGGNQQAVSLSLIASAVYSFNLQPSAWSDSGDPGMVVSYTLRITNTGNATDTFSLSYAGSGVNGQSEPGSVGPLNALSGSNLIVTVKVPDAALAGSSDVVTVTALSAHGGGQASSRLTTTANPVYTLTLTPPSSAKAAAPGAWVTYTVGLNNTGNTTDTFDLAYAGDGAGAPNALTSIGPVGASGNASFVVTASIPLTTVAGSYSNLWVTGASQHTGIQTSILITTVAKAVYTLTVAASGTGSGVVTPTVGVYTYTYDMIVTPTASANTGSAFTGWSGNCSGTGTCSIAMTTSRRVTATFTLNTYVITPTTGSSGSIMPSTPQTVNYGSSITFTIAASTGYHITDVRVDGVSQGAIGSYAFNSIAANHTLTAAFAVNTYSITPLAGSNGSITPSTSQTVNYGSLITFTVAANTGYHITDVGIDGVSQGAIGSYTFNNVTANHTITAAFAINTYNITPTAGANGSITPNASQAVNYGSPITFTIVANTGYHITDVRVDGVSQGTIGTYAFSNVTASHTITTAFAINIYAITPTAGANGFIGPSTPQMVNYGDSITFTVIANTGYHTIDVKVDGVSQGAISTYMFGNVMANHTITAVFAINTQVITPTVGLNGSITPNTPQTVAYGSAVTFTIAANTGYHITDVGVDGSSQGAVTSYKFNNVVADHTITASFDINTYQLNVATAGTGSGVMTPTVGAYTYIYNTIVTPIASANTGSTFTGWSGNCSGTGTCTLAMITTKRVTATFTINTYVINPTADANGSITPGIPPTVNYGDSSTFTITANTGYHITDVGVDGVSQGAIDTYTFSNVTANHIITAAFAINTYALTVSTTGGGSGVVTPTIGTYTYTHGTVVTLTASADSGSTFAGWSGACTGAGSCVVTMSAPQDVAAVFPLINTYSIIPTAGMNGSIMPNTPQTLNSGDSITFAIAANTGSHITDVGVDGVSQGAIGTYTFSNVTTHHSITATFAINTYSITPTAGANGSITPSTSQTVNYGSSSAFAVTGNTGYHITDVSVDGVSQGIFSSYTFTNVMADHTITAAFAINTYSITPTAGANGSITPSISQTLTYGSSITFTVVATTGYHITDVGVDGVSQGTIGTYTFSNVSANHTITAAFAINTYSIIPAAGSNGSIVLDAPQTVTYGSSITFTIAANTGYHITDVGVDGVSQGAIGTYTFSNVTADHTLTATFAINTYSITPTAGANGSITPNTSQTVNYGSSIAFAVTANTGYHITAVRVDGVSQGIFSSYIFPNVSANHTITAAFDTNTYSITPTAGANGSITPSISQTLIYGSSITFTIVANIGYHISDVGVDGVSQGILSSYIFPNISANHTITAAFAINTYVITPTSGANGSLTPNMSQIVNYGDSITFTITANAGSYIINVGVDGVSKGVIGTYTFSNVTANHAITAAFAINTYVITPTADANGSIVSGAPQTVDYGSSITFTIAANTGYHITDVGVDGVSQGAIGAYTFRNVTTNHTITAAFAISTYSITPTAGVNGSIIPSTSQTMTYGSAITFTVAANTGYHTTDVRVDGVSQGAIGSYTFSNVAANHTITAAFAINTYIITPTAGSNGSITPGSPQTANYGASITFTVVANAGYHTIDVRVDGVSQAPIGIYAFSGVTANHTITAAFAINTYVITPTAGPNGSIAPSTAQTVNYGSSITFTVAANTGYHITDVRVDGVSQGAISSYTFNGITTNHTITAAFAINTYSITPTAGANGLITPSASQTVTYGSAITFTVAANAGYHTTDARVDGVSQGAIGSYTFSNVVANHIITAAFAINTYVITPTAGSNGSIASSTLQIVNYGSSITFTVTANTGYHITDVRVDGVSQGALSSYTFNGITSNHTITAAFAINTYSITPMAGSNGSIAPSTPQTVNYGSSIIFTVAANAGYHIADVRVDGVSQGILNSYTFANVAANHTITAAFAIDTFGLNLTSAVNAQSAIPGAVAVYTLHLANTGGTTDTFALSPIGNGWPVSIVPNSSGPLSATFGTTLLVSVTVPSNQVAGTSDVVTVKGVSQSSGVSVALQLTTTASAIYGFTLTPNGVSQSGDPAAMVIYTLHLTNTGNATTAFNFTPSGAVSVFSLSAYSLTLAPFTTGSINVTGTVPSMALVGDSFGLTLTATSVAGGNQHAVSLSLITNAVYGFSLRPSAVSGSGYPGSIVSYTLLLTNTGNVSNTFNLSYAGSGVLGQIKPGSVGPLNALGGSNFSVAVKVPDAALAGSSDVVTVTAVAVQGGGQASSRLTTTAQAVYTFTLTPPSGTQAANPGSWVTYTIGLNNTGNTADTFNLTYAGNGAGGPNAITSIGPVSAFSGASFVVTASVPLTALAGSRSNLWVTGTSQHASVQASIVITTVANTVYGVKLSPAASAQLGRPGSVITYTLRLTNTGNISDTFILSELSYGRLTFVPTTVTNLPAGSGTNLLVVITLPAATTLTVQDLLIRATSKGGTNVSDYVHVYSTINSYSVFLPVVLRK